MPLDLDAVIRGEPGPVRQFIRDYGPPLRGVIRRMLSSGQRQREDDIMQELLLGLFHDNARVLRSWRSDGGRSLKTYLCVYASRRLIDYLRKNRHDDRERPMERLALEQKADHDWEPITVNYDGPSWLGALLARFRDECEDKDWRVLELSYLEEAEVGDIALRLGLSVDAVYQRRHRLKQKLLSLKDKLSKEEPVERTDPGGRKARSGFS